MEKFYIGLLLVVPVLHSCTSASSLSNFTDQSALLAFKDAIKHDPYSILRNWNETTNFCKWARVSCSRERQRVTALNLPNKGLVGPISPLLGNLSFLRVLDLSNNSFHGNIVHELGKLRRLEVLFLYSNQLEGDLPTSFQHCRKLQVISLSLNFLIGGIPAEITTIPSLRDLFLGHNNLTGRIPTSISNMSSLEWFGLEMNNISGEIPYGMGNLPNLQGINFDFNHLTGTIPPSIFNISSLEQLRLQLNALSGTLPPSVGLRLPNLKALLITENQFTGEVPIHLSNASQLQDIRLGVNKFTGPIRTNLGQLKLLEWLSVEENNLTIEPGSSELSFLTSLTNCTSLHSLVIEDNPWRGVLPNSIGNLSTTLMRFMAAGCKLKGNIPRGIGSLSVNHIELNENNLQGSIPIAIGGMKNLQRLYLGVNNLEGSIPDEICLLNKLGEMLLEYNKLSGSIPRCIGNLSNLQILYMDSNKLSSIPSSLWSLQNLLFLDLSTNMLVGTLDLDMRPVKTLEGMDLSRNQISGKIPSTIGAFQSLTNLSLSRNSFWGSIPESIGDLITLDFLDLSHNNLSGAIPKKLESLSRLQVLNLSFNKLSGEIPSGGPFRNFTAESFMENGALCGQLPKFQVPPCKIHKIHKSWAEKFLKFILPPIALAIIIISCLVLRKNHRKGSGPSTTNAENPLPAVEHKMYSYRDLCIATENFCEANLLGKGSFGSVYKGTLADGEMVAVKILNLQVEGALRSFDAECQVLRTARHRNLVKVISTCCNLDLRVLILQYMPNGSLEKLLYSHDYSLNLLQRLGIMIDVASALEYLHHGQMKPIVHCDLKPSNVLLDEELVAHVADFGIAKVLTESKIGTQTKTLGTLGYIAPEYGSEGKVTTKVDIYSYGIMLLEILTRKKPTDGMFTEGLSLREWVIASLPERCLPVLDVGLLKSENYQDDLIAPRDNLLPIMELGLQSSVELPKERPDIKDVVAKLNKIKLKLFGGGNSMI